MITVLIWTSVFTFPDSNLYLIACDVGQGDAILIVFRSTQILVDGGPDIKVVECLSKYLPFWDRKIEGVVLTHPQLDHMTGLIEVFKRYKVDIFLTTPLSSSTNEFRVLKNLVGSKGVKVVNAEQSLSLRSGLIHLDILWPTQEFFERSVEEFVGANVAGVLGGYTTKRDPNEFSVVTLLEFEKFQALLTGDIVPEIEEELLSLGLIDDVEYIKVPHHGSKNGLTREFLDASNPEVAVISSGKHNPYGHPHEEVVDLLEEKKVKILRTDEMGNVIVVSDGLRWWIK